MKTFVYALGLSVALVGGAQAAEYCYTDRIHLVGEETITANMKVVVASVPWPAYPGHPADRPWCSQRWRSGGYAETPIVAQGPANGEVYVRASLISYKGNKVGHDRFVVTKNWYSRTNELHKSTITYEVEVVPDPF